MSEKMKIRLYDTNFCHHAPGSSISSFPGHDIYPKYIDWERSPDVYTDIAFFTDNCLHLVDSCDAKFKIAWIVEPRALVPNVYEQISKPEWYNKFYRILTHDDELRDAIPSKAELVPLGGCWIPPDKQIIYPKTKDICIIASHKNQLPGHQLRHQIVNELSAKYRIDVFGNGYNRFNQTVDVLKDYRYCIVVENVEKNYWMTEKLIQCFRVGTIPIYYGTRFDNELLFQDRFGVYRFNDVESLDRLLPLMTKELYEFELVEKTIEDNFRNAEMYTVCEDYIWETILESWLSE